MEWISVEDRLPEDGQSALAIEVGDDDPTVLYMVDGVWVEPLSEVRWAWPVTHWMPLPEPPKEGE